MYFDKQSFSNYFNSNILSLNPESFNAQLGCVYRYPFILISISPASFDSSLFLVYGVTFNKATQLSTKKNNTADALFICDSSHIIEHVQNGLKMSIHSTTTVRPTIQSFAV